MKKKTKNPKRQVAALKGVITKLKKQQGYNPPQSGPKVKEITVRYGGVIRTGSYENRRVSYEMTSDCPEGLDPKVVSQYLEALVSNQFYEAQIQALEGLPPDIRDEVEDFSHLSPQQACQRIGDFFANYSKSHRMKPEEREAKIKELESELRKLSTKIRKSKNVEERKAMTDRQREIKKELNFLRKE